MATIGFLEAEHGRSPTNGPKMPLPIQSRCVGTLRLQEQITGLRKRYRLAVSPGQTPDVASAFQQQPADRQRAAPNDHKYRKFTLCPVLVLHVHPLLIVHFTPSGRKDSGLSVSSPSSSSPPTIQRAHS